MTRIHRRSILSGAAALLAAGLPRPTLAAMVHDCRELRTALRAVRPGTVIALTPGGYDDGRGPLVLRANRVVLRAATAPGIRTADLRRPVLRVPLLVEGDGVRIESLAFTDAPAEERQVLGPERLRISGTGVEIANAEFFGTRGTAITITGTARDPHIHDCYFHDPIGNPNDPNNNSAVQVGLSMRDTNTSISALIENNLIERWRTEAETISVKSSDNTVRANTFVQCRNLTNRHGEDNIYEDNVLERSGWITVHDRGNQVWRNRLTDSSGIRVMGGNLDCDAIREGGHPQACDTLLEGNTGRLIIGYQYSGHRLPAEDTVVRSHNGRIELRAHRRTTLPRE